MLQLENILLDESGHAKLIDFGLAVELATGESAAKASRQIATGAGHAQQPPALARFSPTLPPPPQPMSPTGSLIYMAPELLRDKVGGRCTDWWALGVVSYELLTGRSPWSSLTDKKQIRREILLDLTSSDQDSNEQTDSRVRLPECVHPVSAAAEGFVSSLLRRRHAARLGSRSDDELLGSPFFAGLDWRAVRLEEKDASVEHKGGGGGGR